jgi:hypothetical protein
MIAAVTLMSASRAAACALPPDGSWDSDLEHVPEKLAAVGRNALRLSVK